MQLKLSKLTHWTTAEGSVSELLCYSAQVKAPFSLPLSMCNMTPAPVDLSPLCLCITRSTLQWCSQQLYIDIPRLCPKGNLLI